jgi:hypothetical protein
MLEARKRTALDGKTWWCVFDTETMKWSTLTCFSKYKSEIDCLYAINKYSRLHCRYAIAKYYKPCADSRD